MIDKVTGTFLVPMFLLNLQVKDKIAIITPVTSISCPLAKRLRNSPYKFSFFHSPVKNKSVGENHLETVF